MISLQGLRGNPRHAPVASPSVQFFFDASLGSEVTRHSPSRITTKNAIAIIVALLDSMEILRPACPRRGEQFYWGAIIFWISSSVNLFLRFKFQDPTHSLKTFKFFCLSSSSFPRYGYIFPGFPSVLLFPSSSRLMIAPASFPLTNSNKRE